MDHVNQEQKSLTSESIIARFPTFVPTLQLLRNRRSEKCVCVPSGKDTWEKSKYLNMSDFYSYV